jgi:hypothetical protein
LGGCRVHVLRECFLFFSGKFIEKTLQLFVPNSKRLRGYNQWMNFFVKKCTPLGRPYMNILRFLFENYPTLFLPEGTWRNKKASEFNLELLGGTYRVLY